MSHFLVSIGCRRLFFAPSWIFRLISKTSHANLSVRQTDFIYEVLMLTLNGKWTRRHIIFIYSINKSVEKYIIFTVTSRWAHGLTKENDCKDMEMSRSVSFVQILGSIKEECVECKKNNKKIGFRRPSSEIQQKKKYISQAREQCGKWHKIKAAKSTRSIRQASGANKWIPNENPWQSQQNVN